MKNLKIIVTSALLALVVLFFLRASNDDALSVKPLIATSNFAIYDVIDHIGEEKIELINILPFGVDPHSFEPTPKSIAGLEKSRYFFYSGSVLEPWAEDLATSVKAIDVSKYVTLKEFDEADDDEDEEHHHHHGAYDPHYWLDIDNMKKIAELVTEKLSKVDPKNKHFFEKNKEVYIAKLVELDDLYKQRLLNCKRDTIVVTHNAFSYLADRYHFKVKSLTGLSTEAQPSATDVKRILKEIREKNIQVVFFENFENQRVITTIANDADLEMIQSLQPLGNITGKELTLKLDYYDIMKNNLEKIAKAMQCN